MSPQEKENSIRVKLDKSETLSAAARYKHNVCDTNNAWGESLLQLLAVEHQCFKIQPFLETCFICFAYTIRTATTVLSFP